MIKKLSFLIALSAVVCMFSCKSGQEKVSKGEAIVKKTYLSPRGDSAFFSKLNLDFAGMQEVKMLVEKKDFQAAKAAYLTFRREKSTALWNLNPKDKPAKAKSSVYPQADRIMKHLIPPADNAPEAFLGEDINWEFNPVDPAEPHFTKEWTWCQVNRMPFWNTLGRAYWETLDEKYAKEWASQVIDWVEDNPVPLEESPNGTLTWRTIESGIRMSGSWMNSYCYFLNSPSFTPEAHTAFVTGVIEHSQKLEKTTLELPERSGNWVTMECNGMGTIGLFFPELNNSKDLVNEALARLNNELDKQVYPDGAEVELTTSYHQVSRSNFMQLAQLALKNGFVLPDGYMDKMKKQYLFNLYMMDPKGILPPFNDASPTRTDRSLREAYEIWKDPEFLFGATLGKEGKKPPFDSYYFNWAGYYIMRSGWDYNDNVLWFDAGPVGYGHEHEDMLNMYLYSDGKILLTEPGTYSYDLSEWRRYALSTPGHNTILVDGKEQHRSDIKEARLASKPYNNPWVTSQVFDYGRGIYSSGYQENKYKKVQYMPKEYVGPKDTSITHTRHVVFLKPYYFVAVDFLTGTGNHTYESHFHLEAPNARVDKSTLAVHTLRTDSVQLGLYSMNPENLDVKVVIGQENPILGWMPHDMRKIPTIVYTKKENAPSTFSTFIYPYRLKEPEISYKKVMTDNENFWAENITTAFETASVIILKNPGTGIQKINTGIIPEFSASADLIIIRKPAGKENVFTGFSGLKEYKSQGMAFTLSSTSLVLMNKGGKTLIYCPEKDGTALKFTLPFKKEISISGNSWFELKSDGVIPVTEEISIF
jgi:hypothetical protein